MDPLGCWVLIEYWSISKVFNYIDMGNTPFPGMSNINESWKNNNKPKNATEHSISDVFSGNNDASQQHVENVGPIPGGNYLIGNQGGRNVAGQETWYALYGSGGNGGYSYSNIPVENPEGGTTTRGGFNLHKGTASNGCVTVPSVTQSEAWDSLENTLNNTPKIDYNNSTYTGVMIVLEK